MKGSRTGSGRRRRRLRITAVAVTLLYMAGVFAAYQVVQRTWFDEGRVAVEDGAGAASPGEPERAETAEGAPPATMSEREAARALALATRESVYAVEVGGSTLGSAFVAWVMQGESYLLTSYRTVAPLLEQDRTRLFIRRGSRSWAGEVVRSHRTNGLALIRVRGEHRSPLWQQRALAGRLGPGEPALVVPAGEAAPIGEADALAQEHGRIRLELDAHRLNVGAPVLSPRGHIVGVVTRNDGTGASLMVPIEAACEAEIRLCS